MWTCGSQARKSFPRSSEAWQFAGRSGIARGEARALSGLGHSKIHMRRFGEAIESEQQALDISREIGYPYREGVALYPSEKRTAM